MWFQKICIPLTEGFFQFEPPPPRFSIPGGVHGATQLLEFPLFFFLDPLTPWIFHIHK